MTFLDARRSPKGRTLEGDVCIIGAGAAGLAIASCYLGRGERVILLESGGETIEPETQDLCAGSSVGRVHAPLDVSRLRVFGGTTQHWTAHVRRFDSIDFESRPWVAHSGWPFGREELAPHYARAEALLGLPSRPYDVAAWSSADRAPLPLGEGCATVIRQEVAEQSRRLGPRFRNQFARSENVQVHLHANVLRVILEESRRRVAKLEVGSLSGTRFEVRARRYVLATGGIENARLLLLSSFDEHPEPGRRWVGAFFANHPGGWAGFVQPGHPRFDASFYAPRGHAAGKLRPLIVLNASVQRREQLLNCWIQPVPGDRSRPGPRPALRNEDVYRLASAMDGHAESGAARATKTPAPFGVRVYCEPVPNPESRVRLGNERDALGQRRAVLDWRLDAQASGSVERTLRVFAREVGAAGIGRLCNVFPSDGFESIKTVGSHHHMGTTRIHVDASWGVVDANCRIHGVSNLYVAGSSVFPSYGVANPTLTILALAYRLADHLQAQG